MLENKKNPVYIGVNGGFEFKAETAKAAGKKSKRGPSKVLDPNIKEKIEILYESVLDHLIVHQQELSMLQKVKLLQSLSGYILAKTKPIRDQFTIQKLIDRESIPFMERGPYPIT